MQTVKLAICFHQDLRSLLSLGMRDHAIIEHTIHRQASIKDIIEALQIPHPEIGALLVQGKPVDFTYKVCDGDRIEVQLLMAPVNPCQPSLLRPEPLPRIRFMTDANVARLGSLLRMAGLDTLCPKGLDDAEIAVQAVRQECILLSRDRGLLKRKIISHGHLVRSEEPKEQLAEVIKLYGLQEQITPFSRCMHCNGLLKPVAKKDIIQSLEPLTRTYYQTFFRCPDCAKIYWSGSHKSGMNRLLSAALSTT